MPISKNIQGISGTIGAAATAAAVGFNILTGNWSFASDATAPRSTTNVAIALPAGEGGTFRIDADTVPYQSSEADYSIRFQLKAMLVDAAALPADSTTWAFQEFNNGGSNRVRVTGSIRTDPNNRGLTFALTEAMSGGSASAAGSSVFPPQVPLNTVFEVVYHMKRATGTGGTVELCLNGKCVGWIKDVATSTEFSLAAAQQQWTITLPAFAGIAWSIHGPIETWTGTDIVVQPRRELFQKAYDWLPVESNFRRWDCFDFGTPFGGTWALSGSLTGTISSYSLSGTNPIRRRWVLSGTSSQTGTLASVQSIGTCPWNEDGNFAIQFPRIRVAGGASVVLAVRNAANDADVIAVTVNSTTITQNSTTIGTHSFGDDVAVVIELYRDGGGTIIVTGTSVDSNSQYAVDFPLLGWTPAASLGKVEQRLTIGSANCELDGCWIGPRWDASYPDSWCAVASNGSSPSYYIPRNHIGAYGDAGSQWENIPGGSWTGRDRGAVRRPLLIALGRPGRTLDEATRNCMDKLRYCRCGHFRKIGGSINDITAINNTDPTTIVERMLNQDESTARRLTARGNLVTLSTMLRHEVGFTANENVGIDLFNAGIRAMVERIDCGGRLEFFDAAAALADNARFMGGDNVHPLPSGSASYNAAYGEKRAFVA